MGTMLKVCSLNRESCLERTKCPWYGRYLWQWQTHVAPLSPLSSSPAQVPSSPDSGSSRCQSHLGPNVFFHHYLLQMPNLIQLFQALLIFYFFFNLSDCPFRLNSPPFSSASLSRTARSCPHHTFVCSAYSYQSKSPCVY